MQFCLVDRGTPVPLRARISLTPGGAPLSLVVKGNTSRFSTINDSLQLLDAGIPIVAGTDMGFPVSSLVRELELYVQAGFTPLQALQCATITPARVMRLEQRTDSIEAGKQAGLVLLEANLLEQIRNVRRVRLVIRDGQVYKQARMRELADFGK